MNYPEFPGFKKLGTSSESATKVKSKAQTLRDRIMDALESCKNFTPDECAQYLGESILSIRPRFSELYRMGYITETGERRRNESGHSASVWRARTATDAEDEDEEKFF